MADDVMTRRAFPVWWVIGAVVILAGVGFLIYRSSTTTPPADQPGMFTSPAISTTPLTEISETVLPLQKTFMMEEQNDSGETGTATLTDMNGTVKVTLELTGAPVTAQPAHIHAGACPAPGAVRYPLTDVVAGRSETTINATWSALMDQTPLAINVHKSAAESNIYVACTDLTL